MTLRRWPETLLWIAVGAIGVALLEILPIPRASVFWARAFDSGHVPLFAGFAVILLRLSRLWLPARSDSHGSLRRFLLDPYVVAMVLVGLLAGMTEGAQIVTARDADPIDGIRDLVGGAAMLAFCFSFRPGPAWRRFSLRVIAIAVVLASFVPFARCVYAHYVRAAAFPRVVALESATEEIFFDTRSVDVDFGGGVATVRFRAGEVDYPRFGFEVVPDWRGYQSLIVDVVNLEDQPVTLCLRIHDYQHDRYTFSDRFNTEFVLAPGPQRLEVELAEVERAPATRLLDLSAVQNVSFFVEVPPRDLSVRFTSVRLARPVER